MYICAYLIIQKCVPLVEKIKVGSVSYLNAKPLIYGLDHDGIKDKIEFNVDYPSRLAQQLIDGQIDVGLVPVATIMALDNPHIISKYCIAAHKKVNSVCLYSEVPIDAIEEVYLDYQSRTSVQLAQILMKHHWKKEVKYIQADENYIEKIGGKTAGIIIGDRAMQNLNAFNNVYDLSEYWHDMTGKDFVFAAWIANKPMTKEFIDAFEASNAIGFQHLEEIVRENWVDYYDLKKYYTQDILYTFDNSKIDGLQTFLTYLGVDKKVTFQL